jgi:hypothetical protein
MPSVASGANWSVPAPLNTTAPGVAAAAATLRRISSSDVGQSSPIPRCAVSIASATAKPSRHRCSRYAIVLSQSIAGSSQGSRPDHGSATTCTAAKARRSNGPAAVSGNGLGSAVR